MVVRRATSSEPVFRVRMRLGVSSGDRAMAQPAVSLYQAGVFVLGCMVIHGLRAYARWLTPVLVGVAMVLAGILAVDWLSTVPNTLDSDAPEVRAITGFE